MRANTCAVLWCTVVNAFTCAVLWCTVVKAMLQRKEKESAGHIRVKFLAGLAKQLRGLIGYTDLKEIESLEEVYSKASDMVLKQRLSAKGSAQVHDKLANDHGDTGWAGRSAEEAVLSKYVAKVEDCRDLPDPRPVHGSNHRLKPLILVATHGSLAEAEVGAGTVADGWEQARGGTWPTVAKPG